MDKVTLDSMELRDWLWCEGKSTEKRYGNDPSVKKRKKRDFARLRVLRNRGLCEIGVSTQLFTDLDGRLPAQIDQAIGPFVDIQVPALSTFPIAFPVVFPESGDLSKLFQDMFPQSTKGHKCHQQHRKDVLQLYAHRVAGSEVFLTEDKAILSRQSILWNKWSVRVMSLDEYLTARTKQAANTAL